MEEQEYNNKSNQQPRIFPANQRERMKLFSGSTEYTEYINNDLEFQLNTIGRSARQVQ